MNIYSFKLGLVFCLYLGLSTQLFAQQEELDTRVDNLRYWKLKAEQGLTKLNPNVKPPAAVKRSSVIKSAQILNTNSPDVLISNTNNNTQSENSIFINPRNPMKALNSNNSANVVFNNANILGTSSFRTTDQGETWNGSVNGTGGLNRGDPAAVIGNNEHYYVGYITQSKGQGVAYSTNEGASWTGVTVANAQPGNDPLDKNHLWIDNSSNSPHQGNLYDAWTIFEPGQPNDGEIEIARSTNNGLNWSTRRIISNAVNAGNHNQGVNLQTGPNGEVYAIWAIYDSWPSDETAIGFTRSTNGGASFAAANRIISNIRGIRATGAGKNMGVNSFPTMAVDISNGPNRGNIYVVWANVGVPGTNTGSDVDVYMIRSTDRGTSWSTPTRVNQDPINQGRKHYFPWITCDPITGALSVIFYDDRNVGGDQLEVFVATSTDGGTNWDDFRVSDVAFTPTPIPGTRIGYFGDYLGISARNGVVYPVWTDNRTGTAQAYTSPFVLGCIDDITLQNTTIPNGTNETYQAANTITASTVTIAGTAVFEAGQSIMLNQGFEASVGSEVDMSIEPCDAGETLVAGKSFDNPTLTLEELPREDIKLSPNPNKGKFKLEFFTYQNKRQKVERVNNPLRYVGVYNLMGVCIFKKNLTDWEDLEIDISKAEKGVYILRYFDGSNTFIKRVINEN